MNFSQSNKLALALVLASAISGSSSHALTITLPDPITGYERQASLASATAGAFGTGNATAAVVNGTVPFNSLAPWTEVGSAEGAEGTSGILIDGLLTVNLTSGTWGSGSAGGTWAIAPSFWTLYGDATISLHVGNGGGDPDHFIWLIEQDATSGTWSYNKVTGTGGGLSNIKLYGAGDPRTPPDEVPDTGSALLLLGAASLVFGAARRLVK